MAKAREEGYVFFTGLLPAKARRGRDAAIRHFLSTMELVRATQREDLGTTWLEIGCLFEIRAGMRMPRRWPPNNTLQERMTEKGVAVADHVSALKAGVK